MARLLVRLKARLVRNTLELGVQQALGLVFSALFGLVGAAVVASALWGAAGWDGFGDLLVLVFAAVWLGWLVLPALTFSSDETLDPRRFSLLPLRHRQLVPGLLAGGLVGVGPIATLLGASGAVLGTLAATGSAVAGAIAAVAVVLLLVTSVAWSRALLTALSNVLGSRRGRDVITLAAGLLAVGAYVASQALPRLLDTEVAFDPAGPAGVLRWTPGGMSGAAIRAAVAGETLVALGALAAVAGSVVAALGLWVVALGRLDRRSPTRSSSARASALYPRSLAWLPPGRVTVVAVRFLRSLVRDPRVRTQALGQLFIVVPMAVVSLTSGGLSGATAPLAVALVAFPLGLVASNQLGLDGPALWLHEVAGADAAADLRGRNLAILLVAVPVIAVLTVGAAVLGGAFQLLPAGVLLSFAVLGTSLGVANVAAVLLPIPVPERRDNVFGATMSGQGCVNSILLLFVLLALALLLLPLFLAAFLLPTTASRTLATLAGVAYGAAWWWGGTRLAVARLVGRGPELLASVHPGD